MTTEPIAVTLRVIEALEMLGVPYFIGGSLASTLHGEPRLRSIAISAAHAAREITGADAGE